MKKKYLHLSKKKGLPPGTLVHVGEKKTAAVRARIIEYNANDFNIRDVETVPDCCAPLLEESILWLDVVGIHQVDRIEEIGNRFNIHPLVMEDILNTNQRPKFEQWDDYGFFVLKLLHFDIDTCEIQPEQTSFILKKGLMISFQETEQDDFIPIINRILNDQGRIRKMGADYLLYSLIDSIVDNYFDILEKAGTVIEDLEDSLLSNPAEKIIGTIHTLKREMMLLRKSVWPLREVISRIERGECPALQEATLIYFKDIHDHIIQIVDTIELFRDMLSGMIDIYLSSVNNKMSQVMKLLTIITTIFIPLSFITGIYGMNFQYMPGLASTLGFYLTIAAMIAIALSMVAYFRIKKWF